MFKLALSGRQDIMCTESPGKSMKRGFVNIIAIILLSLPAYAQDNEAAAPIAVVDFPGRVQQDLATLQSEKSESVSLFFRSFWQTENTFSPSTKKRIEALYDSLEVRNYNVRNFKFPFISTLSGAAANLASPGSTIISFLDLVEKGLRRLETNQFKQMLNNAEQILERKALYYSKYYQLNFDKGSAIFAWNEAAALPVQTEPTTEMDETSDWTEEKDDWDASEDSWDDSADWGEETEAATETKKEPASALIVTTPMPELLGPVIVFKNIDLTISSGTDSARIYNTGGTLELIGKTFVATGGKLTWEHLGMAKDELYADLSAFSFEVNKSNFIVEQATLHYPSKVSKPVKGLLEFKTEKLGKNKKASYPKFQSYKADFDLNFVEKEGLYLKGGVSLRGTTLSTASLNNSFSFFEIQDDAQKKFRAKSREFIYKDSTFTAEVSQVSIYQRRDSIYHPGVSVDYNVANNELMLLKGAGGFKKTPFNTSFFKIDFEADKIVWQLDSAVIDISILVAANRRPARFESAEYFNDYRYSSLAGLSNFHPLQLVVNASKKQRTKTLYLNELIERSKINGARLNGAMKLLMENGFINYDEVSGRIELLDKAYHYVNSKWGRKDYDNLQISSISSGLPNGQLNLEKGTLEIIGVEEFEINEKLSVRVEADSGKVVIFENRDLQFDGTVFAGNYEYVGTEFKMDYDSFLIAMPQIDKIKFNVSTEDNASKKSDKDKLQNQLVETAGTLYINDPNNKSARKNYPQYPIFNATKGATVYFLGEEILDGAYDESLYFSIPKFQIDSASSSDPKSVAFAGEFHSGGIFPSFEEKLRVMPDKSLGFRHAISPDGIDLLDGEAKFYGEIKLDNQGLRGGKKIEYLTTTLISDNITFFKDSIKAPGEEAFIKGGEFEGASFPDLQVTDYNMRWLTSKDSLYLDNKSDPFQLYQSSASLDGSAIVSKRGVFGRGELSTRGSQTKSEKYNFQESKFSASNATFSIESSDTIPALAGDDIHLTFDLETNIALITPEVEGDAAINFPYAAYKTSIPSAEWILDEKIVAMRKPEDIDISNSYFYSTNPEQDSLVFNATGANYNIVDQSLIISGIPYIQVADARITPSGGEVIVGENGKVNKLYNATLTLDTLTTYHNLYNAEIDILSRSKFEGSATYRYVNSVGDTFSVKMGEFKLEQIPDAGKNERQLRTVSSGSVVPDDRMLIGPGMFYKGAITMYADKPALSLDGYVQLDLKNIPDYDTWIKYGNDGSAKAVVINFDEALTELGNPLQAGLHFDNTTNELYATFINDKRAIEDKDFFTPEGLLTYSAAKEQFIIESSDKTAGTSYAGKYFAYNEEKQKIDFEGPLSFLESTDAAAFKSAGTGSGDLLDQSFNFNVMLIADYDLPNGFTELIGTDMLEVVQRLGIPEATKDLDRLLPKIANIAGDNIAKRYEEVIFEDYVPLNDLSSKLTKMLNFTNLDLVWSSDHNAWYSVGKIGLSNTGATDINANLDGFLEIAKNEEGDSFKAFIQVSPSCWYFFHYEQNRLIFASSNKEANELINKKSKAAKAKFGEFVFLTGDIDETIKFIEDYRLRYYDIDAPYFLEMAKDASEAGMAPVNTDTGAQKTDPTAPPAEEEDDDDGF